MLFNSIEFILFLIFYYITWYFFKDRFLKHIIIIGGILFYSYLKPYYFYIPILITLVGFYSTKIISNVSSKKIYLFISIFLCILPLLIFKYTNFIFQKEIINYSLPIGISFITFTMISYIIDVYNKKFKIELSFSNVFGYIIYFPQLIAGPILRPSQLLPYLFKKISVDPIYLRLGFFLIFIGLVKKILIADQISVYVDLFYDQSITTNIINFLVAFYGFAIQIYCDFSGYTDIAIGLALIGGITLPKNFDRPYLATSIIDFWRSWHITLSLWFRDYLYIPLGGSKISKLNKYRNIFLTMLICGLWHGAGLNFIIWGIGHGLFIILNHYFRDNFINIKINKYIKILFVFHLVCILWIFFRADFVFINNILIPAFSSSNFYYLNFEISVIFPILITILFLITHKYDKFEYFKMLIIKLPKIYIIPIIIFSIVVVIVSSLETSNKFIYFDF